MEKFKAMTPHIKAVVLVDKFLSLYPTNEYKYSTILKAKQSAIIVVNEIIDAIDWHDYETPNKEFDYWGQVKTEIENL